MQSNFTEQCDFVVAECVQINYKAWRDKLIIIRFAMKWHDIIKWIINKIRADQSMTNTLCQRDEIFFSNFWNFIIFYVQKDRNMHVI
jgi:hypothetical protein